LELFTFLTIEGHQNWIHYDSGLLISRTFLSCAESSVLYYYFFIIV